MIPITIPIPISITIAAAGFEVNRIAANGPLGAILAGIAPTAAGRIAIPFIVIVVRMPQQIRVPAIGARIEIHLRQGYLNQLAVALAMPRGIQAIVKALAHEALLVAALAHAVLHPFTGYRTAYPMGRYALASQHTPEAGCKDEVKQMQTKRKRNTTTAASEAIRDLGVTR